MDPPSSNLGRVTSNLVGSELSFCSSQVKSSQVVKLSTNPSVESESIGKNVTIRQKAKKKVVASIPIRQFLIDSYLVADVQLVARTLA